MPDARWTYDQYATHQPVLYTALKHTGGPVIEFGCGHGSTPLLHRYCVAHQRELLTLDTDRGWLDPMANDYHDLSHWYIYVNDWAEVLSDERIVGRAWSVAFVDQSPWEARHLTIQAIKHTARFIVLHDCDYYPEHEMFGKSLAPLNGSQQRGERDYGDVFKYWAEHFPPDPWLYERTGPPTLVGSNFEPCDWAVDWEACRTEESMT